MKYFVHNITVIATKFDRETYSCTVDIQFLVNRLIVYLSYLKVTYVIPIAGMFIVSSFLPQVQKMHKFKKPVIIVNEHSE